MPLTKQQLAVIEAEYSDGEYPEECTGCEYCDGTISVSEKFLKMMKIYPLPMFLLGAKGSFLRFTGMWNGGDMDDVS